MGVKNRMRRDLFVFAGQSNMMGASVYPPKMQMSIAKSYEYKHKAKRLGSSRGDFVLGGYPVGEFSYKNMEKAYATNMINENNKSLMTNYRDNTYFCPGMSSLKDGVETDFGWFSEATASNGASLAPMLVWEWENAGYASSYAHIAKGGVSIAHFVTDDMVHEYRLRIKEYNHSNGTNYLEDIPTWKRMPGAAEYFLEKCRDFFVDSKNVFTEDDMSERCLFWLQGESDADLDVIEYELLLEVLWDALKKIGFTRFFCFRVGFFGKDSVVNVMKAQECFVQKHQDAYMITRVGSYFPYVGQNEAEWFIEPPGLEYRNCRDSFYGFSNQHINEKGFALMAKSSVENLRRVLIEGVEPILEIENIRAM